MRKCNEGKGIEWGIAMNVKSHHDAMQWRYDGSIRSTICSIILPKKILTPAPPFIYWLCFCFSLSLFVTFVPSYFIHCTMQNWQDQLSQGFCSLLQPFHYDHKDRFLCCCPKHTITKTQPIYIPKYNLGLYNSNLPQAIHITINWVQWSKPINDFPEW